jgi:hypothetical protein
MKKSISIIMFIFISIILLIACGESKKEIYKDSGKEQITKEEKEIQTNSNREKTQPEQTILGEAPEAVEPEIKDYDKIALRCQIVLLEDAVTGIFRKLTKPMALDLVEKGKTLVVRAENGAIFFVYNEDKTFGSKNLARFAANDFIGILGKTKYEYGLNIIFARYIESSD